MPTPNKDQASSDASSPPQLLANPAHWPSLDEAKTIKAPIVPSKAKPGRRPSATAEQESPGNTSDSQSPQPPDNTMANDTTSDVDSEQLITSIEGALAQAAELAASEKASAQARSEADVLAAMAAARDSPQRLSTSEVLTATTLPEEESEGANEDQDNEMMASRFAAEFAAEEAGADQQVETPQRSGVVDEASLEQACNACCDANDESAVMTAEDLEAAAGMCNDALVDENNAIDITNTEASASTQDENSSGVDTVEESTVQACTLQQEAGPEVTTAAGAAVVEEMNSPYARTALTQAAEAAEAEANRARELAAGLHVKLAESRAQLASKGQATAANVAGLRSATTSLRSSAKASLDACAQDVGFMFGSLLKRTKQHVAQTRDCEASLLKETLLRKKLFNELQAIKGNIRVFVRVRPPSKTSVALKTAAVADASESKSADGATATEANQGAAGVDDAKESADASQLAVKVTKEGDVLVQEQADPKKSGAASKAPPLPKAFEFDHVFGSAASQEHVFHEVSPLVTSVVDGYHASIMAYGQTGSGKTWTMEGNADQPGVNTRALSELFRLKSEREASGIETVNVELTMVEVYNDQVKDLLRPVPAKSGNSHSNKDESGDAQQQKAALCDIRLRPESEGGGVHLPTATVLRVQSETEVTAAMARGQASRSVGKTKANEHSSRSHSVLMINVACHNAATHARTVGRLCLVDLAGSERIAKTGATGETLKEAQNINKSLSALGNVISALRAKQDSGGNSSNGKDSKATSSHVPYRDSKLTYLLQDSLGADNKTLVIVQVSPEQNDVQETVCSLTFGQRARNVELGGSGGGRSSGSASQGNGKAGGSGNSKAGGGASSAAAAVALAKAQQDAKEHAKRAATLAERLAEESKSLKAAEKALQMAEVAKAKAVSGAEQEVKSLKAQLDSAKVNAARAKQQATVAAAATATTQGAKSTKAAAAAAAEEKTRAEAAAEVTKLREEMDAMRANYEQQIATLKLVAELPPKAATTPARNTRAAKAAAASTPTAPSPPAAVVVSETTEHDNIDETAPASPKLSFAAVAASPPTNKPGAFCPVVDEDETKAVSTTSMSSTSSPTQAPANINKTAGKTPKKSALAIGKTPKKATVEGPSGVDENASATSQRRCVSFKSPFKSPDAKPLGASRQQEQQPPPSQVEDHTIEINSTFVRSKGTAATPLRASKRALGPKAAAINKPRDSAPQASATSTAATGGAGPSRVTVAEAKPKAALRNGPLRVTSSSESALIHQPLRRQSVSRWH